MAYEPLNLQNGQTLTAEDLQHMEQGIQTAGDSGTLRVNISTTGGGIGNPAIYTGCTADKTKDEIAAALEAGMNVIAVHEYSGDERIMQYAGTTGNGSYYLFVGFDLDYNYMGMSFSGEVGVCGLCIGRNGVEQYYKETIYTRTT